MLILQQLFYVLAMNMYTLCKHNELDYVLLYKTEFVWNEKKINSELLLLKAVKFQTNQVKITLDVENYAGIDAIKLEGAALPIGKVLFILR